MANDDECGLSLEGELVLSCWESLATSSESLVENEKQEEEREGEDEEEEGGEEKKSRMRTRVPRDVARLVAQAKKSGAATDWAAKRGYTDVMTRLLNTGFKPDPPKKEIFQDSPFMIACESGHLDVARLLLERGAKVDRRAGRISALRLACEQGHFEVCQFLLHKPNTFNDDDFMDLLCSAVKHGMKLLRLFLESGIKAADRPGFEALKIAVKQQSLDLTEILLNHNAPVNFGEKRSQTPLHLAVGQNDQPLVKFLLQHHAKVNIFDFSGQTPLGLAAEKRNVEIIKILLSHNAATDLSSQGNHLPIHHAMFQNCVEGAKLILEKNPGVGVSGYYNLSSWERLTPLHFVVRKNWVDFAQLLLENGADLNERGAAQYVGIQEKKSPLELCNSAEMKLLLESFETTLKPAKRS